MKAADGGVMTVSTAVDNAHAINSLGAAGAGGDKRELFICAALQRL